jgi:hypothetical protein
MRLTVAAIASLSTLLAASAFQSSQLPSSRPSTTAVFEYIPAGFTKETWAKFKTQEEAKKKAQSNLGRLGPKGFKSRSFQSFQEALERGEAEHLLPVFNAKEKLAKKQIKMEDIPYMQRGGSWDNTDVKGASKKKWLDSDKQYASGGFKKEQSVSIFGVGQGLDWTGARSRTGPEAAATNNQKQQQKPKKFGWF